MQSRHDRNALAEVINRYLTDQITAFQLDVAISEFKARTKDATVQLIGDMVWFYYDDIDDHKVVASKEEWDFFQRLLLVLKSDGDIVTEMGERYWTIRQPIAATGVIFFLMAVLKMGWGTHLFCITAPLGLVSIMISRWRSWDAERRFRKIQPLVPFGTMAEMLVVRRKAKEFIKIKYPLQLNKRRIRSSMGEAANWLHFFAGLLFISPLVLLYQSFPERDEYCKVTHSNSGSNSGSDHTI